MTKKYYSKQRLTLLSNLAEHGPLVTKDIATMSKMNYAACGMDLLSMFKREWVARKPKHTGGPRKPAYLYSITEKGQQQLNWLKEKMEEQERTITFA